MALGNQNKMRLLYNLLISQVLVETLFRHTFDMFDMYSLMIFI